MLLYDTPCAPIPEPSEQATKLYMPKLDFLEENNCLQGGKLAERAI